jgi:hypothetical protein
VNVQCAHLWPNVAVCLMLLHIFQVMALLHSLRTAIVEDYQQIPGTMTSFVFSALPVMVRPEHTMYDQINKFLLQRPSLDLSDVPMFYSLFNSPNAKDFKAERSWILQVILHAVAPTGLDLQLFRRRHVFAILMAFFDAPFADAFTCRLVIQILEKACATSTFLVVLVESHGLVAWLVRLISVERLGYLDTTGTSAPAVNRNLEHSTRILGTVLKLLKNVHLSYMVCSRVPAVP